MSGIIYPDYGTQTHISRIGEGEKIFQAFFFHLLGKNPLDPKNLRSLRFGTTVIIENLDPPASKAFMRVVEKIKGYIKKKDRLVTKIYLLLSNYC